MSCSSSQNNTRFNQLIKSNKSLILFNIKDDILKNVVTVSVPTVTDGKKTQSDISQNILFYVKKN